MNDSDKKEKSSRRKDFTEQERQNKKEMERSKVKFKKFKKEFGAFKNAAPQGVSILTFVLALAALFSFLATTQKLAEIDQEMKRIRCDIQNEITGLHIYITAEVKEVSNIQNEFNGKMLNNIKELQAEVAHLMNETNNNITLTLSSHHKYIRDDFESYQNAGEEKLKRTYETLDNWMLYFYNFCNHSVLFRIVLAPVLIGALAMLGFICYYILSTREMISRESKDLWRKAYDAWGRWGKFENSNETHIPVLLSDGGSSEDSSETQKEEEPTKSAPNEMPIKERLELFESIVKPHLNYCYCEACQVFQRDAKLYENLLKEKEEKGTNERKENDTTNHTPNEMPIKEKGELFYVKKPCSCSQCIQSRRDCESTNQK